MLQRVLILGHNDLDGICGTLAVKAAHREDHTITKFCSYANIDSTLLEALQNSKLKYDRIVLVDICFNTSVDDNFFTTVTDRWNAKFNLPEAISKYVSNKGELVVLDHHPRAFQLNNNLYRPLIHRDSIIEMSDHDGNLVAGSDLAARYYINKTTQSDEKFCFSRSIFAKALVSLCSFCGAYDVWNKKSDQFTFGSKLAMAQSLMADDCYGFLNELESTLDTAVIEIVKNYDVTLDGNFWKKCLSPILFNYLHLAETWFSSEVISAKHGVIQHHPFLHEIHTNFFESLVAQELYNDTQGIVLIRYDNLRDKASKVSLRKHDNIPVNLGNVAKKFGGGGHFSAAGITFKNGYSIHDVVDYILSVIESEPVRKRFV